MSEYKLREAKLVEAVTKAILFQDSGSTEDWEANNDLGQAAIDAYREALSQPDDSELTVDEIVTAYEKAMNLSLRSQDLHGVIRVCRAVIAAHEAKKAGVQS